MMHNKTTLILSSACLLSSSIVWSADNMTEFFSEGKAYADINTRYEYVDEDNAKDNADAGTLRARIGYDTGSMAGFSGKIEFSHNTDIFGLDDFNSTQNGETEYSVVADPDATEVNQAFIDFRGLEGNLFRYGRQRIILDNARFVGNVGWRQNEQTYDAFMLSNESISDLKVSYSYIDKVQTFLDTTIDHNTHLFNVKYKGLKAGAFTGYYYALENEDNQGQSSDTYGIQFAGKTAVSDSMKILYLGEYAQQKDAGDNAADFDLDYYHINGGVDFSAAVIKLGYEVLEGDGASAFQTPLATKHAWNGWADKFLGTPADGLEDLYVSVGAKFMGIKMKAIYHDFESEQGGADYGDEIDLVLVKPIAKNYKVLLKYANYDADSFSVDTEKFWLAFNAKFSQ